MHVPQVRMFARTALVGFFKNVPSVIRRRTFPMLYNHKVFILYLLATCFHNLKFFSFVSSFVPQLFSIPVFDGIPQCMDVVRKNETSSMAVYDVTTARQIQPKSLGHSCKRNTKSKLQSSYIQGLLNNKDMQPSTLPIQNPE